MHLSTVKRIQFFPAISQNRTLQADSKISQVIVFLQGAQVERKSKLSLPAGKTDIVFSNVSPLLDKQSIQLKADQNITVLAVNHQVNFLKDRRAGTRFVNWKKNTRTCQTKWNGKKACCRNISRKK